MKHSREPTRESREAINRFIRHEQVLAPFVLIALTLLNRYLARNKTSLVRKLVVHTAKHTERECYRTQAILQGVV